MNILRNRYIAFCAALLFFIGAGWLFAAQMGKIQMTQTGMNVQSGATIAVKSGGITDHESGSYFKLAGTAVTSSAAELNLLDTSTAGTAVASKALVAGSQKNLDSLMVEVFGLNKFRLRPNYRSDDADSALVASLASGVPTLSFFGTDGDTWSISPNTSDAVVFAGVGGGFLFDGSTAVTTAELNRLNAVTPGTTASSKALVAGSSGELNALTITAPTLGTRLLTQTKVRDQPVGGMLTVTVTGLDADDLIFGQLAAMDAAADSAIYIRKIVPGTGSAVVYFTATPSDSSTVCLLSLQD